MNLVRIQKCKSYDYAEVFRQVSGLLDFFAQESDLFIPGKKVLLKPNMLTCRPPEQVATTHPAVIRATAEWLKNKGLQVSIGDSPPAVFGRTEEYWQTTGFAAAAKETGARLISFESEKKQSLSFFSNGAQREIHVTRSYYDADIIINLPKFKTHNLTRITGAIKNLYGLIPGLQKAVWHKVFPKSEEFAYFITDLASKLPTQLTIMDAIEGMEGQGPAGGNKVFPGFLLASTCPVAIDRIFCRIIGIDENSVATLKRAAEIGWGPQSSEEIELSGATIDEVKLENFKVPMLSPQDYLPDFVLNAIKSFFWAGPALAKTGMCIRCRRCQKICPVDAIEVDEQEAQFNRKVCISCFCCMEVCPVDAIIARKSPLLQLVFKLRNLKRVFKRKK